MVGSSRIVRATVALLAAAAGVAVAMTPSAQAGAPNYECAFPSARIGIDQHARTGLARRTGDRWRHLELTDSDQNGESLDIKGNADENELRISIQGLGRTATLTFGDGTVEQGTCAFVPGNFVLGVTTADTTLRSRSSVFAPIRARITNNALVWTSGRYGSGRPQGARGWTPVRVVFRAVGGETLGIGAEWGSPALEGWVRTSRVAFVERQPQGGIFLPSLPR
jgi:hypothetical protein